MKKSLIEKYIFCTAYLSILLITAKNEQTKSETADKTRITINAKEQKTFLKILLTVAVRHEIVFIKKKILVLPLK